MKRELTKREIKPKKKPSDANENNCSPSTDQCSASP